MVTSALPPITLDDLKTRIQREEVPLRGDVFVTPGEWSTLAQLVSPIQFVTASWDEPAFFWHFGRRVRVRL